MVVCQCSWAAFQVAPFFLIYYYMWSAHAKGTGDAKCRIPLLPLNLMPQIFFYIHVSEQGIDS